MFGGRDQKAWNAITDKRCFKGVTYPRLDTIERNMNLIDKFLELDQTMRMEEISGHPILHFYRQPT